MAALPGIIIKVGAETRDAIQGLNRVNSALGKSMTRGERFRATVSKMGPALLGVGAAAGAVAVKVGVDAVQAFMDEEKAVAQFDKTLENLDLSSRTDELKDWVDNLQFSANVADDELRPALEKMLRATGDVAKSQNAVTLALDISASTGKDLETVINALSSAYSGNRKGLVGLRTGLDKAYLSSASMDDITAKLRDTMGGSNAARTDTLSGAMDGVTIAWSELQEAFGKGLMGASQGDTVQELADAEQQLRDLATAAETVGGVANDALGAAAGSINALTDAINAARNADAGDFLQGLLEWMTMGAAPDNVFASTADDIQTLGDVAATATKNLVDLWTATNTPGGSGNVTWRKATPLDTETWAAVDERLRGARNRADWAAQDERNRRRRERRQRARQRALERRRAAAEARRRAREDARARARTGIDYGGDRKGISPWA